VTAALHRELAWRRTASAQPHGWREDCRLGRERRRRRCHGDGRRRRREGHHRCRADAGRLLLLSPGELLPFAPFISVNILSPFITRFQRSAVNFLRLVFQRSAGSNFYLCAARFPSAVRKEKEPRQLAKGVSRKRASAFSNSARDAYVEMHT
jgi:hypothetical protein